MSVHIRHVRPPLNVATALLAPFLVVLVLVAQVSHASYIAERGVRGNNNNNNKNSYYYDERSSAGVKHHNSNNEKFVDKKFANKEVMVEDEDEDTNLAPSSSSSSSDRIEITPNHVDLNDDELGQLAEFGPVHHNHKASGVKKNADEELDQDEMSAAQQAISFGGGNHRNRKQRIDSPHDSPLHAGRYDQLKAFHRQGELQRMLQQKHGDRFDFDYDEMLREQLLGSQEPEQEVDLESVGAALRRPSSSQAVLDELDRLLNPQYGSDERGLVDNDDSSSDEYLLDDGDLAYLFNALNNKNARPVDSNDYKNTKERLVEVKEKLLNEDDYNRKFFKKKNLDLNMESRMPVAELVGKAAPSMAQKQSHYFQPELDQHESINSRIDMIRRQNDHMFMFIVAGCAVAGVVALLAAGVCWYTVHRTSKNIVLSEYGSKGGKFNSGSKISLNSGDRRLAQSAQMYHYQHQKQQMIAMEKANNDTKPDNQSDSEGETEEGDYTVYECPGLAPTGEMEVKNPLFKEDFSSNNISAALNGNGNNGNGGNNASMPPAYSAVINKPQDEQLVQIDQQARSESPADKSSETPASAEPSVTTVNEKEETTTAAEKSEGQTSTSDQQQQ